jgi:hypothetical protein
MIASSHPHKSFLLFIFLCTTGFVLAHLILPGRGSSLSQALVAPDFQTILSTQGERLAGLSSEAEALNLFHTVLVPLLDLGPVGERMENKGSAVQTGESRDLAVRLTTELAAWGLAESFKRATDLRISSDMGRFQSDIARLQSQTKKQAWLVSAQRPELDRAVRLLGILTWRPPPIPAEPAPSFEEYSRFLDRTYSELTWIEIAEQAGPEAIRQRLTEVGSSTKSDADHEELASHYFETRLRPVLTAHFVALAIRAGAASEQRVRADWARLHEWQERSRQRHGLARLCGTWQWTVHNHKNHQDHKMVLVFPPPERLESGEGARLRPANVVVLADTVYLRWEFQGAVQEDSLLFTNKGHRLEGSFTNSAGAWGSITGKKTAACETRANSGQ